MKTTTLPKPRAITITRLTNAEALASVRKVAVRSGVSFVPKNAYRRNSKHRETWN